MVRVKISKQRLEQMNYFEKVDTKDAPTDVPNQRNLVVAVEEKNTGNVALGAGFSPWTNSSGTSRSPRATSTSSIRPPSPAVDKGTRPRPDRYAAPGLHHRLHGAVVPRRRLRLDTELYYRDLQYLSQTYDTTVIGGNIGLTKQLPFNLTLNTTYTLQDVNITFDQGYPSQYPPKINSTPT